MKTKGKMLSGGNARRLILALLLGCASLLVPGLRAEDSDGAQAARAVRLSDVEGTVHLSQGSQVLTDQALANTPLFEGTRIDTGNDGRAEIQFEDGSVARISPQSSLSLTFLRGVGEGSDRDAEIQVNGGLAYFELQGDTESNQIRVRFGETVVSASGFTVVRINLDKAPGEVAVFSGNAHLEGGPTPAIDLHGGESVALNATDPANYNLTESIEPDSWDAWNSDRDQEMTTASAERTDAANSLPDNNNPAWTDLDANGNWYNVPGEGYVWSPNEAASPEWDPYGNGYWMSTPAYGYMWISGYPWGYLPYQCGAWNYYSSFGWGWAPGVCAPWWGGYGGWAFNIGFAPPHYHCPVRPRNPRPMGIAHVGAPLPLVAVNRPFPLKNMTPAPRDRTGTVMIAGNVVRPLPPVQQTRNLYFNHSGPGNPTYTGPGTPAGKRPPNGFESGFAPHPVGTPATGRGSTYVSPLAPKPGGPTYTPRPAPSVPVYAPPPRPSGSSPAPPVRTYTPPPPPRTYTPPPAPVRSAPPPSPPPAAHPSGGGSPHANPR